MNDAELDAYGKLAEAMAVRVDGLQEKKHPTYLARDGVRMEIKPPYFHHYHMSAFEGLAEALWLLGILVSINQKNAWDCVFRFSCGLTKVYETARHRAHKGYAFKKMLATYIYYREDYGFPNCAGYGSFDIQENEHRLYDALIRAGCAKVSHGRYEWTFDVAALEHQQL